MRRKASVRAIALLSVLVLGLFILALATSVDNSITGAAIGLISPENPTNELIEEVPNSPVDQNETIEDPTIPEETLNTTVPENETITLIEDEIGEEIVIPTFEDLNALIIVDSFGREVNYELETEDTLTSIYPNLIIDTFEFIDLVGGQIVLEELGRMKAELDLITVFIIDTKELNFTTGSVTKRTEGSALYKCLNWDGIKCNGWEFVQDLVGQEYSIELVNEEAIYGELYQQDTIEISNNLGVQNVISSTQADGLVSYGEANIATPRYRTWDSTNDFSAELTDAQSLGTNGAADITWVVTKGNHERDEIIMGTVDKNNDINVQVYNAVAASWGNLQEMSIDISNSALRSFDLATEDVSGDTLIVYETSSSADTTVAYRIWNGTGYSSEQTLTTGLASSITNWVALTSRPGTDDIMVLLHNNLGDLQAQYWNGSGFDSSRTLTLSEGTTSSTTQHFAFAWEGTSDDGLVTYGEGTNLVYRTFSIAAPYWSGEATIALGEALTGSRLCTDPNSDYVGMIWHDSGKDANARMWDGDAILTNPPAEDNKIEANGANNVVVDCAWFSSTQALFGSVDDRKKGIDYITFTKSNTWSADLSAAPITVNIATKDIDGLRFTEHPTTNEVMATGQDTNEDISGIRWDGSAWQTFTANQIEANTEVLNAAQESVMFDWFRYDPLPNVTDVLPQSGSYAAGSVIEINATVVDQIAVDTVLINITLPDNSVEQLTMTDPNTDDIYNATFTSTTQYGTYTLRIIANDTSVHQNINNTETTTFTIAEINPPEVVALIPVADIAYGSGATIEISANITDQSALGAVYANITRPGSTVDQITLSNSIGNKYNNSYTIPAEIGTFNIVFFANDTFNNINSSESTNFTTSLSEGHSGTFILNSSDSVQNSFFNGTFYQIQFNDALDALTLNGSVGIFNITGNFTSEIFNSQSISSWDNISWTSNGVGKLPANGIMEDVPNDAFNMSGNILLMHFDENSGTLVDYSGNGYDGTQQGGITYSVSGKINTALTFDGTDDYVNVSTDLSVVLGQSDTAGLSAWIKTTQAGNDVNWQAPGITGTEESGGENDVFFGYLDGSGNIVINAGGTAGAVSNFAVNDGIWHHIYLTRVASSGEVKVYVDGILHDTATSASGAITTPFYSIGRIEDTGGTSENFNGQIDEVAIFDRILSDAEVLALYQRGSVKLNFTAMSCNDYLCNGESYIDIDDTTPFGLSLDSNQYFRYQVMFETGNTSFTPELYNVSVHYTPDTTSPEVTGLVPLAGIIYNISDVFEIAATITDIAPISLAYANITYPNSTVGQIVLSDAGSGKYNNSFTAPNVIGTYTVLFFANDSSNNINNTETTTFTVQDVVDPTITPLVCTPNPAASAQSIICNVTVIDNIGVDTVTANVTFPNSTVEIQTVSNISSTYSFTFTSTTNLGAYNVTWWANDTSDNTNNGTDDFVVSDLINPEVTALIPSLSSNYNITNVIEISTNVTDTGAVNYVYANITYPNSTVSQIVLSDTGSGKYNNSFTAPSLIGIYTVLFFANDSSNNVNSSESTTFIVNDVVNPAVLTLVPSAGTNYNITNIIEISTTVTDDVDVSYSYANITYPNSTVSQIVLSDTGSGKYNNSFTAPSLIGTYTVLFFANDSSNNVNSSESTTFIVNDITSPSITPLTCVPNPGNISQSIICNVTITDSIGVDTVTANITFPNSTVESQTVSNIFSVYNFTFTTTDQTGTFNVTWWANDTSNNVDTGTDNFVINDVVNPTVNTLVPSVGTNYDITDVIEISATLSDDVEISYSYANITYPNNTVSQVVLSDAGSGKYNNSFTAPSLIGTYTVLFFANDSSNNVNSSESTTFIVNDIVNPTVSALVPSAGTNYNVSNSFELAATLSDDVEISYSYANITYPNSTVSQIVLSDVGSGKYNNSFTAPNVIGTYTVLFFANDSSNNVNSSESTTFIVNDIVNPSVSSVTPLVGSSFSSGGSVSIATTITDDVNVSFVYANITLPDSSYNTITLTYQGSNIYGGIFSNTSQAGTYTLQIIANDTSNNLNDTVTRTFSVLDSQNPIVTLVSPANEAELTDGNITFTCNATDNGGIENVTLYHNINGIWQENETNTSISGTSNQTSFVINDVADGTYLWNCLFYDSILSS